MRAISFCCIYAFNVASKKRINTVAFNILASDYTLYPFSTTNPVDYKNLRNVYMDAAFFPHLRELDFKQEGWRLEHENPNGMMSSLMNQHSYDVQQDT